MESWKERFYKEAGDTVRELFDEQNWTDEKFDEMSLQNGECYYKNSKGRYAIC